MGRLIDLAAQLTAQEKARKGIITHLNALTCQYLRQSNNMSEQAKTLKRTVELICLQCFYLQTNIAQCKNTEELIRETKEILL